MSYSWDFKAEVLAVYEADGPAEASRRYGPHRDTILRWAKACGISAAEEAKRMTQAANDSNAARWARIREKLGLHAEQMLDRMDSAWEMVAKDGGVVEIAQPPASVCKDLATTAAILVDKCLLLAGEATSREEVRHDYAARTESDLIHEAESILREAADG